MPLRRYLPALAFVLTLAPTALVAASEPSTVSPPPLPEAVARVRQAAETHGLEGEVVVADRNGAARGFVRGLADRARQTPHRADQRWLWASVTKQVVATLVMQDVARGRLALDAPVGRYLPEFGGNRAVTLRQLLLHRSGLPNPEDTPHAPDGTATFYRDTGPAIADTARALDYCAGPATGAPGGDFRYNNCDYLVLGAVLARVTGRPLSALVRERIARPLGLGTLRLARDGAVGGGSPVVGYDAGGRPVPTVNVATYGAAAALTGSARDLARLDQALLLGRLLPATARDTAWAGDPALGYQALGVWSFAAPLRGCTGDIRLVERRGDVAGTEVRNVIAPDLGRAVVVFTNQAEFDFGEVWQGQGGAFDLLSAALCGSPPPGPAAASPVPTPTSTPLPANPPG